MRFAQFVKIRMGHRDFLLSPPVECERMFSTADMVTVHGREYVVVTDNSLPAAYTTVGPGGRVVRGDVRRVRLLALAAWPATSPRPRDTGFAWPATDEQRQSIRRPQFDAGPRRQMAACG